VLSLHQDEGPVNISDYESEGESAIIRWSSIDMYVAVSGLEVASPKWTFTMLVMVADLQIAHYVSWMHIVWVSMGLRLPGQQRNIEATGPSLLIFWPNLTKHTWIDWCIFQWYYNCT
jgi:hypothetical protein